MSLTEGRDLSLRWRERSVYKFEREGDISL